MPILLSDGAFYGTLCGIDPEPRRLTRQQTQLLYVLARLLATQIERDRELTARAEAQVQLREALARTEAQYQLTEAARAQARSLLDSVAEAISLVAPDRRVLAVNRRFGEMFGVEPDEVVGRRFDELGPLIERTFAEPARIARRLRGTARAAEGGFEEIVAQVAPERRELHLFSAPVRSNAGTFLGRLYVFRDVTKERAVDRMKTEMVSLVSHELRMPLTAIKGYVDLLLEGATGELQPDQCSFLDVVKSNTDRLVALVNDLLDIARLESGAVELRRTPLELGPLVIEAAAGLYPLIEAKQQELALDLPRDLPPILADRDRLAQVLTNLLSNAHKYTPPGGRLTVAARAEGAQVHVDVADTGIGLTPEEQAKLFTKFFRARNPVAARVSGTGLGLAITRSLVELHGGTITAASAPGRGSTFSFTLPIASAAR